MSIEDNKKYWADWAENNRDAAYIPSEEKGDVERMSKILDTVDEWNLNPVQPTSYDRIQDAKRRTKTGFGFKQYALMAFGVLFAVSAALIGSNQLDEHVTGETKQGVEFELPLPDGSTAFLNNKTSLEFKKYFLSGKREIWIDGQVHLSVAEGEVLNIHAGEAEVELIEGEVNVFSRKGLVVVDCYAGAAVLKVGEEEIEIESGQRASYMRGAGIKKRSIEPVEGRPWLNGKTKFDHASLTHVLLAIEVRFDIKAHIEESTDTSGRVFTGYIYHNDVEKSIQSVLVPLGLRYEIQGKTLRVY